MIFFRYTHFLEDENEYLKSRIEALEVRNQELVKLLIEKSIPTEVLKPKSPDGKAPEVLKRHSIVNDERTATCSCGWSVVNDDPGELQQAISSHYRESSVSRGRKSWPQVKAQAEAAALQSTGE